MSCPGIWHIQDKDFKARPLMSRQLEIILRRSIAREHPRWTLDQIAAAVREAETGRGPYAILAADLQAANGG